MKKLLLLGSLIAGALAVGNANAQTNFQFPQTPWQAYAPTRIECGWQRGVNFNVTTDTPITISTPSGFMFDSITISGPSVSMTTAAGGFYTGAAKTGVIVVAAAQTYAALTTPTSATTGNAMLASISTAGNTTAFPGGSDTSAVRTLYFSLTTPQGAAATANIRVFCRPLYG